MSLAKSAPKNLYVWALRKSQGLQLSVANYDIEYLTAHEFRSFSMLLHENVTLQVPMKIGILMYFTHFHFGTFTIFYPF